MKAYTSYTTTTTDGKERTVIFDSDTTSGTLAKVDTQTGETYITIFRP